MDDYLSKPMPLADLKTMLEKWLPTASQSADLSDALFASAAQGTAIKPVDVSVLAATVGGNPVVIKEFLHDFRSSATRIATELTSAYTAGQTLQVGTLAHKLKSSARSVGALALGKLCMEIEEAGKAGQVEALTALLPRFEAEIAAVNSYLDTVWPPEMSGTE
jgi:HPt (histidine-containing phosphotransfer) domain-containing protein